MACASCGGRGSRTIGQQHAARVQARQGGPAGATSVMPLTLGADDDSGVVRVRVLKPVQGMRVGSAQYVTGADVQALIASGALIDISKIGQRRRQWQVGAYTYTDYQQAQRVAAVKGLEVIEVA